MKKIFLSIVLVGIIGAVPISTFASFSKKNSIVLNKDDKDKDKKAKKSACCTKSGDGKAACKKGDASNSKTDTTKICNKPAGKGCCKKTIPAKSVK